MSDPSLPVQNAVEAALRTNTAVKNQFPQQNPIVYVLSAPNKATYPFIVIGEDESYGERLGGCGTTNDVFVRVHIWAREESAGYAATRAKAKNIAAAVRGALDAQLTVSGYKVYDWSFDGIDHMTDGDGLTAHSVATFSYSLTPTA